ncbi:unnamed protein product [Brachionus calyciflorus]|uniref:Uncharacterized protein n=1 Tax=Brachionus calyciflorus TaxID=104777 RepID=A0A814BRM5_9BILA|nr:unnamed protein product [Brachionus calyciflorus]
MNRKAKFAYFYIIIGLLIFLITFLIILNHYTNNDFLRQNELEQNQLNLTHHLIHQLKYSTSSKETNLYLKIYCNLKNSASENDDTENISSEVLDESFYLNIIKSKYFKNFLSYLLCSTEKVYFILVFTLCLFGFLLLIYGCVSFYKNDIKLLNRSVSGMSSNMTKSPSELCCIKSGLESPRYASERMCPFIYDELPAFMLNNNYTLMQNRTGARLGSYRTFDTTTLSRQNSRTTQNEFYDNCAFLNVPDSPILIKEKNISLSNLTPSFSTPRKTFKNINVKYDRLNKYSSILSDTGSFNSSNKNFKDVDNFV